MRCLVTGSTGYVGGRLVPKLLDGGHAVRAMARNPDKLDDVAVARSRRGGARRPRRPRIADRGVRRHRCRLLLGAFDGHVVRLRRRGSPLGAQRRRRGAAGGREAIVYLGGLHPPGVKLSPHLQSRTTVGDILIKSGIETVVLQAGIVVGSGSASFEMMRHITNRLPAMTTPKWVHNKIQPISIDDVLHYLAGGGHRRRACVAHLGHRRTGRAGIRRRDAGLCRSGGSAPADHRRDSVPDTDDREPVDRTRHADAHRPRPSVDRVPRSRCGDERARHRHRHHTAGRRADRVPGCGGEGDGRAARYPADPHWAHVGRREVKACEAPRRCRCRP